MATTSLPNNIKQKNESLGKRSSKFITFVIITKDRPQQVKQLIVSILKANLSFLSLLLIDDSNPDNFVRNRTVLKSLSIPFQQLNSNQAIKLVELALEKVSLSKKEISFIRNCTGKDPPFQGFAERFFKPYSSKNLSSKHILHFAPYSIARNLGIYCAIRYFNPEIILFLDDDCRIFNPSTLNTHIKLIGSKLDQSTVIAVSGLYRELREIKEKSQTIKQPVRILRGMDAFLLRSLSSGSTRFQVTPAHMLGGALILSKRAFTNLPFDPFVARGEDHMYALDLATVINNDELFVRDSSFIVDHGGHIPKKKNLKLNILRDIFRFLYCKAKTGRSFIPFFSIRWTAALIADLLLNTHSHKKFRLELFTLIYAGRSFAKKKGNTFRKNLGAWKHFIEQSTELAE